MKYKNMISILHIEDDLDDVQSLKEELAEAESSQHLFKIIHADNLEKGLEILSGGGLDIIILDLNLPDSQGIDTLRTLSHHMTTSVPILVMSGLADESLAFEAISQGAQDYLVKGKAGGKVISRILRHTIERFQLYEAVQNSEIRTRAIIESSSDGIVIVDEEGTICFVNPSAEALFGRSAKQLIGTSFGFPITTKQFYEINIFRPGDTNIVIAEMRATNFTWEDKPAYLATLRDITDNKRVQEALMQSEEMLNLIISNSPSAIELYDLDGLQIEVNKSYESLWGFSASETVGKFNILKSQEVVDKGLIDYVKRAYAGETVIVPEYEFDPRGETEARGKGRVRWLSTWIYPLKKNSGEITNIVVTHEDVTEKKKAEDEILQRLKQLETLYTSSLGLFKLTEPLEIGQKALTILEEKLNWHHAAIRLYNPENGRLELLTFLRPNLETETEKFEAEGQLKRVITLPGQGLTGWVFQHNQFVNSSDVLKDPRYIETFPGIRSGMYSPLALGNHPIGTISIESVIPNAFTETDEWLLSTLATQVASAIENARLFIKTNQQLKQVQSLRKIDNTINGSLDLFVTLEVFFDVLMDQLGADAVCIFGIDPHTQTLSYLDGRGFRTDAIKNGHLHQVENFTGTSGLQRIPIHIIELGNSQDNILRSADFRPEEFKVCCSVPLISKGQSAGVLEVFMRSHFQADQEWKDFLQTLAGQAAIAIENTTLYQNLQQSNIELNNAYDATIEGWSRAMDLRDKETEGHSRRVTELTLKLAQAFDISDDQLTHIRRGALLHDMGKLGVPDSILLKPGKLTDEEWVIMRKHPQHTYDMLSSIDYLRPALAIPYCHHEKWDGTGYPRGLKGEQIPLEARIFAVIDVFDALTSDRPYRKAWSREDALIYIKEQSELYFDPAVVKAFLQMMEKIQ